MILWKLILHFSLLFNVCNVSVCNISAISINEINDVLDNNNNDDNNANNNIFVGYEQRQITHIEDLDIENIKTNACWTQWSYLMPRVEQVISCKNGLTSHDIINATVTNTFDDTDNNVHGFSAIIHENNYVVNKGNQIIYSFRGTDSHSIKNWLADLDTIKTDYYLNKELDIDCKVHSGFQKAFLSLSSELMTAHNNIKNDDTVLFLGHSLGGALATLAYIDFMTYLPQLPQLPQSTHNLNHTVSSDNNIKANLVTFGQPRVGDKTFSKYLNSQLLKSELDMTNSLVSYRVTHSHDPVPHMPLENMGFYHSGTEIYFPEHHTFDKYILCNDDKYGKCSDSNFLDVDIADHLDYLDIAFGA